jgi:hypothetical protein
MLLALTYTNRGATNTRNYASIRYIINPDTHIHNRII